MEALQLVLHEPDPNVGDYEGLLEFEGQLGPAMEALLAEEHRQ
jgi:hypothetical protein